MNGYFYIDDISKQQYGPFPLEELMNKNITPETMIWHSGMNDWAQAQTIEELKVLWTAGTLSSGSADMATPESRYGNMQSNRSQQGQYNPQNNNGHQPEYNNNRFNEVRPIPKNWLIESILVTLFCCPPFGIAGIISATKVETLYYTGDYEASVQASKDAKKWTLIGLGVVLVLFVLYFIFSLFIPLLFI